MTADEIIRLWEGELEVCRRAYDAMPAVSVDELRAEALR